MREQLDQQAVRAIATAICELPKASLPTEPPIWSELRVRGTSFQARLLVGPGRDDARLQMWVYFAPPTGPWPQTRDCWSAWVRCDGGGDRADRFNGRLAKSLRRRFAPGKTRALEADGIRVPSFLKTAHWWVVAGGVNQHQDLKQHEDLEAQIWLFLLQADLLLKSAQAQALAWCWDYLQRRFRVEGIPVTDTIAFDVLEKFVHNRWRPPAARSWRSYVERWIYRHPERVERRLTTRKSQDHAVSHDPSPEAQAIAQPLGVSPEEEPSRSLRRSSTCTVGGKDEAEAFTVDEAAHVLNIPPRTLYDWIGIGRLQTIGDRGTQQRRFDRMLISESELERLGAERRPKPKGLIVRRQRTTGASYDAARKYVYRLQQQGLALDEIASRIQADATPGRSFSVSHGPNQPRTVETARASPATPARRFNPRRQAVRSERRQKGFPRLSASGLKITCGWAPVLVADWIDLIEGDKTGRNRRGMIGLDLSSKGPVVTKW